MPKTGENPRLWQVERALEVMEPSPRLEEGTPLLTALVSGHLGSASLSCDHQAASFIRMAESE